MILTSFYLHMLTTEKLNIYKDPYLDAKNNPTLDVITIALSTLNE